LDNFSRIIELANRYLVTNVVSKVEPVVIEEGRGAYLKDIDGKEYIDCFSGISVVNTGHCNPEVVEAAINQIRKLIHAASYIYYVTPVVKLAEKLAEITPGKLQKTLFVNSGAEAVECSLKLARKFTKRYEFLALMCSFHGRTLATLSVTGQYKRRKWDMGPYLTGVSFVPAPYCYRCFFGLRYPECDLRCARFIEKVIEFSTGKGIAAFIAEPILGEGGIIVPPPEYFKIVKEILDKHEILFICDEVQTGFARTGKMFAIEHYSIQPDLMVMAKGIANGFPLGACIAKPEISGSFEPEDHFSTFGGNPVSAAAALANIEYMQREKLPEKALEKSRYVIKRLEEMMEKHRLIGDVRGKGLMIGVELVKNRETKKPAIEETRFIRDLAREKGVLFGSGGVKASVIRIQPPLTISVEELDKALNILEECIAEAEKRSM